MKRIDKNSIGGRTNARPFAHGKTYRVTGPFIDMDGDQHHQGERFVIEHVYFNRHDREYVLYFQDETYPSKLICIVLDMDIFGFDDLMKLFEPINHEPSSLK